MKTKFTLFNENFTRQLLSAGILLLSSMLVMGQTLHVVEVRDFVFDPAALEISVGDTVEWQNVSGSHNVNGTQTTFSSNPESFGNAVGEDWTYRYVFTTAGDYQYRCDPHIAQDMAGTISVLGDGEDDEQFVLTVEFSEMNPHVGQDFYLAVIDSVSGKETGRVHTTADVDFSVEVSGIESGKIYFVDFWADHNGNGTYDAPPTDHAWRLELSEVTGDTTLSFTHNTNFTDIMWKYLLTVEFSGMNPHVGQDFYLALVNSTTGKTVERIHTTAEVDFSLEVPGLETGSSYHVDFWADHNGNGLYDSPPTDHAWRIELESITGDTTVTFEHNTDFTDIMWKNLLTVEFSGMNPHVGQDFYLAVSERSSGMEIGRVHTTAEVDFSLEIPGIESGRSYNVDFWADHNGNGRYDAPPTDHAWRIELDSITGDTTLLFSHNTDFTDIMWKNLLTVEFNEMNPHVGQDFYLAVTDTASGLEINRVHLLADTSFTVEVAGLEQGQSYHVDFWADHNGNGMYDAPPADHAWRLQLDSIRGDTTITFNHNTDFTDIMWKNKLTVEFREMNPHIGQTFTLYVVDSGDESVLDTVTVEEITTADFTIESFAILSGGSYHINFWADHNGNGMYDAPPTDHAWQLHLDDVSGDTTLTFVHNTDFTDIFAVTSAELPANRLFRMYPNPASGKVWIETDQVNVQDYNLSVFDITGKLAKVESLLQNNRIEVNVQSLNKGIYFLELKSTSERITLKLIKN